jgi:hypothetical protein
VSTHQERGCSLAVRITFPRLSARLPFTGDLRSMLTTFTTAFLSVS